MPHTPCLIAAMARISFIAIACRYLVHEAEEKREAWGGWDRGATTLAVHAKSHGVR